MLTRHIVVLSAILTAAACAREQPAGDTRLRPVSVSLATLGGHALAPQTVADAHDDAMLHVELKDTDGVIVFEREVADPRLVFSEFDAAGQPDPRVGLAEHLSLTLELPNLRGTLRITDSRGAEQRTAITPDNLDDQHQRTQALGVSADVRGPPTQLFGRGTNGPDILLLSEGFTDTELPAFDALAASVGAAIRAHPSFAGYGDRIGILAQRVRSVQSGADDPASGLVVNTAFDATYNVGGTDRCLFYGTDAGRQFAASLGAAAGAEVVVLVVNSAKYGGCANTGTFVVALPVTASADTIGERSRVAVHELGHALFNLGDEYGGATCQPSRVSTGRPNTGTWGAAISRFPAVFILPWRQMIPAGTPIPTPVQGAAPRSIGAFEGAEYCDTLRYRPSPVCGMRAIDHTYCPVCQAEVARVFATRYPVMPSCMSFCDYGQCGECDEGGYITSCYIHNGCGGMYDIP